MCEKGFEADTEPCHVNVAEVPIAGFIGMEA
jgi:hypothetical protein